MLIVPDVQDVYTPLQTDIIVQISEVSFRLQFCLCSLVKLLICVGQSLSNPR